MTGRSAALQGGLAVLGLLAAQLTFTREPERAPGEVVVIDAAKADIGKIRYEDDDNILGLERRTEAGDPVAWLHLEEKPKTPPGQKEQKETDGKSAKEPAKVESSVESAPPAPPVPPTTPPRDVRGNVDALKLVEKFSPFVSPRSFGVIEGAKLKELGLDEPHRHLEIAVRGDTRKYDVGIALNAQNSESFLRDVRDGRVYLMPRGLLNELGNGKRLVDPRLHLFETKEFDHVQVTVNGKTKEYVHLGRDNFATDGYASPKTPDKRDQTAKNWMDLVWREFPMEVLGKDELPKVGTLKTSVRIDYTEKGKPVGWIEVAKLEGASAPGENADLLYARSEHTVGWTHLHASEQIITDGEHLVAGP